MIMLAGVQGIKIGDPIHSEDHRFAVDYKMLLAVFQRGLGDPWIAPGPFGAVAGEQPHANVLPDDQQPVAVMLYFVDAIRPVRDLLAGDGQAELVRHTHERQIGICDRFYDSGTQGPHVAGRDLDWPELVDWRRPR